MAATGPRLPKCPKCGGTALSIRDGAEVGGMPGIKYQVCSGCGYTRAIVRRPRRPKF